MHKKEQCIQCWQLATTAQTVACVMCHSVNTSEFGSTFPAKLCTKAKIYFYYSHVTIQ